MRANIKNMSIVISFAMVLTLSGCGGGNIISKGNNGAYNKIITEIDRVTASFSQDDTASSEDSSASSLTDEFKNADDKKKAEIAFNLADDMAIAQLFGVVTNDMLVMSGNAVKAYPHPLLLNNYAAMLADKGSDEDSLFFFLQALDQEPQNPILLTNIANIYLGLEDFGAAERYAKEALTAANDFGPAYQVLTTIHLKNNNSILAAETMVKSAKHCFNDITMYHFDSFLAAISELDPAEDEYPLKEEFIDELYGIARENVDTKDTKSGADTPGAQIVIKPFPQIGNPDNLISSYKYLQEELEKIYQKSSEVDIRIYENGDPLYEYLNEPQDPGEGVYPVKKNLRQIYAFKVLQSYYEYKLNQCSGKLFKRIGEIQNSRNDELSKVEEAYSSKIQAAEEDIQEAEDELLGDMLTAYATEKNPNPKEALKIAVELPRLKVEQAEQELAISKRHSQDIITASQDCYNETKQILEEFWLRAGGLLKYFTNEKIFNYFNDQREKIVYNYIQAPLSELQTESSFLYSAKEELKLQKFDLEFTKQVAAGVPDIQLEMDEDEEEDFNGGDAVPEIEKEAFTKYPEKGDLADIGIETGLFGFSASVQYNGEEVKLSVDTPFGGIGGGRGIDGFDFTEESNSYVIHGVRAEGSTEWFKDTKVVKQALDNAGKSSKALGKIGKIGFGFSNGIRTGEFIEIDGKEVKDRGLLYVRETGGDVGWFGRSEKIEIKKSYQTGFARKQVTVKYKFFFASIEK